MNPLRILMVEDAPLDAKLVLRALRDLGRELDSERVEDEAGLRRALAARAWDLVLSDWSLPRFSALEALAVVREVAGDLPFIIVSGTVGETLAVAAMRAGADDYVLKDDLARLSPAIERELREADERARRRDAEAQAREAEAAKRRAEEALAKSDEQLRHAQKMEAVGRLAGGVAHDFNNLLSVILSYSSMLLEEVDAESPMRADLEEIRNAGKRAAELTHQLLAFSRQQVIEPRVVELNALVEGMERMCRRILGEDIELVSRLEPTLARVVIDPTAFEQVLMNLVVNSRDAMPRGGRLTIDTANVTIDEAFVRVHFGTRPGPHVRLRVADTGSGIDAETMQHIFEPFFTTKETGKGTGLGLSTVFGIVRQAGGTIWVASAPGAGTTFEVLLPAVREPTTTPRPPGLIAGLAGNETVLLVEDDDAVRGVVRGILRRNGYRVIEAPDPTSALAIVAATSDAIHLLLTDIVMPQMSGPELAKRVRAQRPAVRVLCMSGYTDETVVRGGLMEADFGFLQKPILPDALLRKVRETLLAPRL